jgi:hypothetical protein
MEERRKMPEEILALDEVKRIAIEFVRTQWNAEVTEFKNMLRSPDYSLYEVDGRAGIHQQDMQTAPPTSLDTIIEFTFKLQISARDRKVVGWRREPPQSPPPPPPSWQPVEAVEPVSPRDYISDLFDKAADRNLKEAKAKYYEEKAKELSDKRHKDKTDSL